MQFLEQTQQIDTPSVLEVKVDAEPTTLLVVKQYTAKTFKLKQLDGVDFKDIVVYAVFFPTKYKIDNDLYIEFNNISVESKNTVETGF